MHLAASKVTILLFGQPESLLEDMDLLGEVPNLDLVVSALLNEVDALVLGRTEAASELPSSVLCTLYLGLQLQRCNDNCHTLWRHLKKHIHAHAVNPKVFQIVFNN